MGGPIPQRRKTKQDRSAARQRQITEGAIAAISDYGIAGITHRRVAKEAHVSLAATTYYYETKRAIIADASQTLLARYVDAFRRFVAKRRSPVDPRTLRDFVLRLVLNATGKHRIETIAWCEIILNAARQEDLRDLSRAWFRMLHEVWNDIAASLDVRDPDNAVVSAIDTAIGFLFTLVPLGLSEVQLKDVLAGEMCEAVVAAGEVPDLLPANVRGGRKAEETRERILAAAVEIVIADGIETLTFRNVSERAGMTIAAPTYYFSSISALYNATQLRLFEMSITRYRADEVAGDDASIDLEHLADLASAIFLREVTEFRKLSLACFPVYIQSYRDPSLRPGLWSINAEHLRRWETLLAHVAPDASATDRWVIYATFIGKMIRYLATAPGTRSLAGIRRQFAYDIRSIAAGQHWSQQTAATAVGNEAR